MVVPAVSITDRSRIAPVLSTDFNLLFCSSTKIPAFEGVVLIKGCRVRFNCWSIYTSMSVMNVKNNEQFPVMMACFDLCIIVHKN